MKSEKDLQNYLKAQCFANSLLFYKFASPARRGVPDVMIVHQKQGVAHSRVRFVELKSPSGKGRLSALQMYEIGRLRDAFVPVHIIETKDQVDNLMKGLA